MNVRLGGEHPNGVQCNICVCIIETTYSSAHKVSGHMFSSVKYSCAFEYGTEFDNK